MSPSLNRLCIEHPCPDLAVAESEITHLKETQAQQGAATQKLADKIDSLRNWIMATLGATILALLGVLGQLLRH